MDIGGFGLIVTTCQSRVFTHRVTGKTFLDIERCGWVQMIVMVWSVAVESFCSGIWWL